MAFSFGNSGGAQAGNAGGAASGPELETIATEVGVILKWYDMCCACWLTVSSLRTGTRISLCRRRSQSSPYFAMVASTYTNSVSARCRVTTRSCCSRRT